MQCFLSEFFLSLVRLDISCVKMSSKRKLEKNRAAVFTYLKEFSEEDRQDLVSVASEWEQMELIGR